MFHAGDYFNGYSYRCFVKYILGEDDVAEGANVFCDNGYSLSICKPGGTALDHALRYNEHPIWNTPTLYVTGRVIPLIDVQALVQDMKVHENHMCLVVYYAEDGNYAVYITDATRQALVKSGYVYSSIADLLDNAPAEVLIVRKGFLNYFSHIEGVKKTPEKPRVCVCITSYNRIDPLIRQVFTFLAYMPAYAHLNVAVKGVTEEMFNILHKPLFQKFIDQGRLTMKVMPNKGQLWNHVDSWTLEDINKFDYFCKVDDDDFYAPEYVQDVIDIHSHFPFSLGGSLIRAKRHIFYSAGGNFFSDVYKQEIHTRGELANSFVLSREVVQQLINISKNIDYELDRTEWAIANEDNIMQALLHVHGFVDRGAYIKKIYGDDYLYCGYNRSQGSTSNRDPDKGVYMSHVHMLNTPPSKGNYGIGTESILKLQHRDWKCMGVIRNNSVCTDSAGACVTGIAKSQSDNHITIYWPKIDIEETFVKNKSGVYVHDPNYGTNKASKNH